ncbi:hypothetical protein [Sulfurimonas sp.]|uniref:hypothetical protein n=1 Tax=Sulfurimonas sp. TaxID=2022749 RepID=UPI0035664149
MQRKNYFLIPFKFTAKSSSKRTFRSGIAMIMAIVTLVIVATIMALSLSLTTQTTKRTTDLYLYEQATLLSQSAAEYALLKISQANQQCSVPSLDFRYNNTFDVNITMQYIFTNPSTCRTNSLADGTDYTTVTYPNSNGSVLMDIAITANPTGTTEPIRYFRRSIQKL